MGNKEGRINRILISAFVSLNYDIGSLIKPGSFLVHTTALPHMNRKSSLLISVQEVGTVKFQCGDIRLEEMGYKCIGEAFDFT